MKIEEGKFYKTSDERKARIYAIDGAGAFPIHGAILTNGHWTLERWKDTGKWASDGDSTNDIVDYWREPRLRRLGWINMTTGEASFIPAGQSRDRTWDRAPWLDEPERQ